MKKLLIALAAVVVATVASYGQGAVGQVQLQNKGTGFDNPIFLANTSPQTGPGAGYSAQLYIQNTDGSVVPLSPITTFRPPQAGAGAIADRYLVPATVDVTGHVANDSVTFVLRAWQTSQGSYDTATSKGQSDPFTMTIGGGLITPPFTTGLKTFTVANVPEPSVIALGVLGAAALALRRRK